MITSAPARDGWPSGHGGRRGLVVLGAGVLAALAGCGGSRTTAAPRMALIASSARLPAPAAIDPGARGAGYLTAIAAQLQPKWSDFLEDCRLRLPGAHALNRTALVATFELAIGRTGAIAARRELETSGNGDFDTAIADVISDVSPLPAPPAELMSDDDLVHVRWQFARDRRQAGPATARVMQIELPLLAVTDSLLARGELVRAADRIAAAPVADRGAAAERVMVAALREALASPDSAARRTAVEACGRARVHDLAALVRAQLAATAEPALRLAAITAAGALGDRGAAPVLLGALHDELVQHARLAVARVAALVALGHAADAAAVVHAVLAGGPNATALAALAVLPGAPPPAIAARLTSWAVTGDATVRGAVCAVLPAAAPGPAIALIARGLGDADARVRAACAEAAGREDAAHPDAATVDRLHGLARDRDLAVRARAVAAIGRLDAAHPIHAAADPAPAVRAVSAATASPAELRALAGDRDPEVRAAALSAWAAHAAGARTADGAWAAAGAGPATGAEATAGAGPATGAEATSAADAAHALAVQAAADPSPVVRQAAIALLAAGDAALLARLGRDDSPEVALAALVRLAALRGRAALTAPLLGQLVAAPAGSAERARIALAWLLAS